MKKLLCTLAILAMTSTSAMAFGLGGDGGNAKASSDASARAHSSAGAKAHASNYNHSSNYNSLKSKQVQGQAQGQLQGQVNGNADNTQSTTVEGDNHNYREIPVSTAYAPSINPTATCMGSTTGGGQGMNVGISLGTTWESENCMYLETARSFEQAGYKEDAMAVRCQTQYAKAAPSCAKYLSGGGSDPYSADYWRE